MIDENRAHQRQPPPSSFLDIRCRGVRATAQTFDSSLTIITLTGAIDAANCEELSIRLREAVPAQGALILDMAVIDFIGVAGLRTLQAVRVECARRGVRWVLVTSAAVRRLLRVGDRDHTLPAVGSATEALLHIRHRARPPLRLMTPKG